MLRFSKPHKRKKPQNPVNTRFSRLFHKQGMRESNSRQRFWRQPRHPSEALILLGLFTFKFQIIQKIIQIQ